MRALSYGSFGELIYAMPMAGAALANSTTRTAVSGNTSTFRAYKLPADYFTPQLGSNGQAIRVITRGFYSTTGTAPTLQVQCALDTTQGTYGTTLAGTGTYTTETTITDAGFEMEFDAVCTGTGTAGTIAAAGTYQHGATGGGPSGNGATGAGSNLMVGALNAAAINTTVDNYLEVWATWGTAASGNTLTLTQFLIFALN